MHLRPSKFHNLMLAATDERICRECCGLRQKIYGGGRGIRTPGTISRTSVFKTDCFNHSHIPPHKTGTCGCLKLVYNRVSALWPHRDQAEGVGMEFHYFREVREEVGQAVVSGVGTIFMLYAKLN